MNQETGAAKLERPLISGEVLLCKEENYGGQEHLITADTSRLDFPIASLRIGPNTGVTIFSGENYGDVSQDLTAELPSFKDSKLQGNPKSIQIWSKLERPLIAGEVLLYKEENYEGREQLINVNTSHLDFPIASLRIGPKTGVTIFSGENFGDVSQDLTAELPSVKESRLQSPAKSIKTWSLPGKLFTGYWAIGVGETPADNAVEKNTEKKTQEKVKTEYLSVAPDGMLTTSSRISVSEEFEFTDGFTGWASSSYLKQVTPVPPPPPGGKYRATANRVHLREGPGTGFRSLGYIQVNEIVTDLGVNDSGTWRQVLRHDGQRGWVSARYFTLLQSPPSDEGEPVPQDTTRKWVRATAKLNVREGAGTNFTAIGSLQGGEVVEVLEPTPDGSWLRIRRTLDSAEAALGRRKVTLSVADNEMIGQTTTTQSGPLSLGDFRNLTMVNEQEAGFRKFSLLSQDNLWIHYNPDEKHFLKITDARDRTIFCQSIKIAADETQVGELSQGEAALFENPAYWGKAWVFHTSYADFTSIPGLNNTISSIQLGPRTGVTIYRGPHFSADDDEKNDKDDKDVKTMGKQDVTSNLSSLAREQVGDNRISSIQLWQIKEPAALKLSFECRLSQDFRKTGENLEEYSAYRTTLHLPPTVKTVAIWATDATTINVDGTPHPIDETEPVELPNPIRGMVITTDAVGASGASLRTPGLKIRTDTMLADERIMIYPDQQVHKDLANLQEGDLWKAKYTDKQGETHFVITDRGQENSRQQEDKAANAQEMITKVMSTVQYSTDSSGGCQQTVSPPVDMNNKGWVLQFLTYVVSADTLNVREGPGTGYKPIGFLERNDIVQAVEFSADARWIRVRRLKDDLTGWSSRAYLKTGDRFRVTASKLHLRKDPGTDSPSLGYVEFNDVVTGIGVDDTGGWRQIRRSDGLTGWSAAQYFALIQPLPPSPVSAKPSVVRFQEIGQEQVQALRAVAQSPDTGVAQGLDLTSMFTELVQSARNAVRFTAAVIESSLHFIIETAGNVIHWVADTAEKVIAFVEGIFGAIGAAIEEVIKWLQYMFSWGDILKTRDYLYNFVMTSLDDVCKLLGASAKESVEAFFNDNKGILLGNLKGAIVKLGGTVDTEAPSASLTPENRSNGMLDTVDWILAQVFSGGSGDLTLAWDAISIGDPNAPKNEGDEELRKFWDATFADGLGGIADILEDVADIFVTLVQNPDKPLLAVAKLLNLFQEELSNLINAGQKMVVGLLDLATDLIKKLQDILETPICIPFISDIGKWIKSSGLLEQPGMGDLLGWMVESDGKLGFSLLDAVTLILAVPITIVYKALFHEAPFQNLPSLSTEAADAVENILQFASCIIGCVNGAISTISDASDITKVEGAPDPWWKKLLSWTSFVISLVGWLSSLYSRTRQSFDQTKSVMSRMFDWWLFGIEGSILFIGSNSVLNFNPNFEDAVANNITGAAGMVHAGVFVGKAFDDHVFDCWDSIGFEFIPGLLGILPEIASFAKNGLPGTPIRYAPPILDGIGGVAALAPLIPLFTSQDNG